MRHLIVGASGQVGGALFTCAHEKKLDVVGTYLTTPSRDLRKFDITDRSRVLRLIRETNPDVIYLAAAMTNVDRCQSEEGLSYEINVRGLDNVIDAANKSDATIVFISTDYLFDGSEGPYSETDLPNPLNVYGMHKLIGEHAVATRANNYLIVRTTVVFGWEEIGKNFVVRLKQKLAQGQKVEVPVDQMGTPTYNRNFAHSVLELASKGYDGIYNVVGTSYMSRYDFALQVASIFGLDSRLIKPVTTRELGQKAPRPLNAGLSCRKAQSVLKTRLLSSEEGLRQMLKDDL